MTFPFTPLPGNAEKSVTLSGDIFLFLHSKLTALANGCSLFFSREAATLSNSFSETPSIAIISVTVGSPFVIVPVLSRATILILPVCSSAAEVLYKIPHLAPTPLPTIIATGVANPKAQGQLITSTQMPLASAKPKLSLSNSHIITVITERIITVGTKTAETLSAIFAMGAFVAAASLTICIILDNAVSFPTLTALHFKNPD